MFRQSLLWTSCLALLASPAVSAQAPQPKAASKPAASATPKLGANIETRTLKNGLKVIVWPDHDIPNVALYNWFRVGSRNEYPGITGLSHFFEHMMFNGAKKYGPGEFDRVMEAHGGRNNAYTSEDVTVYQDWFPRSALETIFELEADRLQHLSFDPKVIESERGVVYSERRSGVDDANPGALICSVEQIYKAFRRWCDQTGERWPPSQPKFTAEINRWVSESRKRGPDGQFPPPRLTYKVIGLAETATQRKSTRCFVPRDCRPEPGVTEGAWAWDAVRAFDHDLWVFLGRRPAMDDDKGAA